MNLISEKRKPRWRIQITLTPHWQKRFLDAHILEYLDVHETYSVDHEIIIDQVTFMLFMGRICELPNAPSTTQMKMKLVDLNKLPKKTKTRFYSGESHGERETDDDN